MVDSYQVGFVANFAIGVFVGAAALLVATRLKVPGSGALAAYLALVAGNYGIRSIANMTYADWATIPSDISYLLAVLDPPALLLFALAQDGQRHRWTARALAVAPALWLFGASVATWIAWGGIAYGRIAPWYTIMLVAYYGLALVFVAMAHHSARSPHERALRSSMVVALVFLVLPRVPLVLIDTQVITPDLRSEPHTLLLLEGFLALLVAAFVAVFVATAPASGRREARRTALLASALCGLVAAIWLLRFPPLLTGPAYALMYSSRWLVFAGVVSLWAGRQELLGIPATLGARVRGGFALLLGVLLVIEVTSLLMWAGVSLAVAALTASVVGLAVVGAGLALRRAPAGSPDERLRRARLYRARATLGAPPEELESLRRELGLTREQAEREERLIELERAAPREGLGRPAPGGVFAGRYEVADVLGAGAFGLVYAATDLADARPVVLKELRPGWRGHEEAAARLRREAKAALGVSSPHVVALLAIERSSDGDLLVFERVEGETLRQRLDARGALPEAEAARIARDVLAGLDALHAAGVLHRDLKPENVVVRPDGRAVIVDLGAAGGLDGTGTRLGVGGAHPGTPAYMSPEQRRGDALTRASDLYAAATTIWEALAGALPPEGRVPEAWRLALERGLAMDPGARWGSARAFADALPPARAM